MVEMATIGSSRMATEAIRVMFLAPMVAVAANKETIRVARSAMLPIEGRSLTVEPSAPRGSDYTSGIGRATG